MTPRLSAERISLRHTSGLSLDLMDMGATWLSCRVPMDDEETREVILGCPTMADYAEQNAYMGAVIGRVANRIAHGEFTHHDRRYVLSRASGQWHHLHGGVDGFDRRRWHINSLQADSVELQLYSEDGDQGYPGALTVTLRVILSAARQIIMTIDAVTTADTPLSLTHHPYFNLDAVVSDARMQRLQIAATHVLDINADLIPTGALLSLADDSSTADRDFRHPKTIMADWLGSDQQLLAGGYDHAYLLTKSQPSFVNEAAALWSADGRLKLTVSTDMPALHFYAGQYLNSTIGRDGAAYSACAGIALEPEFLPDAVNHPEWPQPSCWIKTGELVRHIIQYDFTVAR